MVQRTHLEKIIFGVVVRVLTLFVILVVGFLLASPFEDLITKRLNYNEPATLFLGLYGLSGAILTLSLSYIFWGSIAFGFLGKTIDYFLIFIFLLLGILIFSTTKNVTPLMYFGLLGVAFVGNLIGYALKVARMHFFPSQSSSRG